MSKKAISIYPFWLICDLMVNYMEIQDFVELPCISLLRYTWNDYHWKVLEFFPYLMAFSPKALFSPFMLTMCLILMFWGCFNKQISRYRDLPCKYKRAIQPSYLFIFRHQAITWTSIDIIGDNILTALCKKDITPLLTHWSTSFLH